jgi:SNF2 family DNA or RNA helicase
MARTRCDIIQNNRRLKLECDATVKAIAARPIGASAVKGGFFTYPPDELVILTLRHYLGDDLELSPACQTWFDERQARSAKLIELAQAEDGKVNLPYGDVLKPYQRAGIAFCKAAKMCIVGDDRGLGKTLEALSVCEDIGLEKVLVVSPGYLKRSWQREIQNPLWGIKTPVTIAMGERKDRTAIIEHYLSKGTGYLVVNYEMIREKVQSGGYPVLIAQKWDAVIFDEGHRLKGRDSQWVASAKKLLTERLLILTGNAIANSPEDVWQLLNILDPKKFASYWAFVEYFCNVLDNFFGKEIAGVRKEHLAQLQFTLQPYLIRRMKAEVAPYLPKKIHRVIEVELEGKQKTFYRTAEKKMLLQLEAGGYEIIDTIVTLNVRLQQSLANPSMLGGPDESVVEKTVIELAGDIIEGKERVIIGMWYRDAIKLILPKLQKIATVYVITGDIAGDKRDAIVESFKHSEKPGILLGTIKAMSEGINADECDNIIYADKSYVPLDNEQLEDRIHRMTSTRVKNYYHIVVADTISQDREAILKSKTEMIDEILSMKAVTKKLMERNNISH